MILVTIIAVVLAFVWSAMVDCYIWNHLLKYFFSTLPDLTIGMAIFVLIPIKVLLGWPGLANNKKNDETIDTVIRSFVSSTIILLIAWIGKEWILVC